jgi:membrane protease YdiL (CAAX protease family)
MKEKMEALSIKESNPSGRWAAFIELAVFLVFFLAVNDLVPSFIMLGTILIPLRIMFLFLFGWVSLRIRNMNWNDLGLHPPLRWRNTILLGAGLGIGLQILVILLVGPIVRQATGGRQDLHVFTNMADGNFIALLGWLAVSWTFAAFGEELVYRGYLLNRLGDLTGSTDLGWGISLLAVALLFGLVHAYQGVNGMLLAGFYGLAQGLVYLATRRNLWVGIICHGVTDTVGFILIYILLQCCPGTLG